MRLDESVAQFGAPLKEQLNLAQEAQHLARFNRNFRKWRNLSFPKPIFPLVSEDVLVETFEEGRLISNYVNNPGHRHSAALANLGLDCYLKMLLHDNFVHADLHPGNIMVRMQDPNTLWSRVATFLHLDRKPQLVLLDVGMVAELTRQDQINLVEFFKAITSKDGAALGYNILNFSDKQTCPEPEAFVDDMKALFEGLDMSTITDKTSEIIGDMMEKVRQHQVSLKGVVSTVVVTTMVLEGWSTKLNPDIKIMDALRDILPCSWTERITRTMDRMLADQAANV
jgi:aarF domain-containing kinase